MNPENEQTDEPEMFYLDPESEGTKLLDWVRFAFPQKIEREIIIVEPPKIEDTPVVKTPTVKIVDLKNRRGK